LKKNRNRNFTFRLDLIIIFIVILLGPAIGLLISKTDLLDKIELLKILKPEVAVHEQILLNPNHKILNYPNKINLKDFNNWVQERGLYFPNKWDEKFDSIIGMNDPGENEKKGSLLIADYGKGAFIYTGLSFFRQLPNGIPGAYKLFVNLISYNK